MNIQQIPMFEERSHINGEYQIVKENTLIKSSHGLSLYEHRIIAVIASMMKPTDENGQHYFFSVKEFANYFNLKSTDIYTHIREVLISLRQKTFVISRPGESKRVTGWINWAEIVPCTGLVEVEIDDRIRPYFLGIKNNLGYTKYALKYVQDFSTPYSFRFYDRFKMELKGNQSATLIMTVEEIKAWLAITSQYKMYGDLKKRVLKPIIQEINGDKVGKKSYKGTDLKIDMKELKQKNKVVSIEFQIRIKSEAKFVPTDHNVEVSLTAEQEKIYNAFLKLGVAESVIQQSIMRYGAENLSDMHQYFLTKSNRIDKPIEDKAAYAATILRKGLGIYITAPSFEALNDDAEIQITEAEIIIQEQAAREMSRAAKATQYIEGITTENLSSLAEAFDKYIEENNLSFAKRYFKVSAPLEEGPGKDLFLDYIYETCLQTA